MKMQLTSFAISQKARLVNNTLMGIFQDYPYSIMVQSSRKKASAILQIPIWGKISSKTVKQMQKRMQMKGVTLMFVSGQTPKLQAVITAPTEQLLQTAITARYKIVQQLKEMSISAPQACPICGQGSCDCLAYYDGYRKAHKNCVDADIASRRQKLERQGAKGQSVTGGFVGALLGALVGLIPTVLLAVFANLISAWLFALIPVAAFFGYKLLGGKMDGKLPLVMVILASLLTLPVLELAQFYASVVEYWDEYLGLGETVMAYLYYMTPADTAINMLQPLLFMGLGLFISWRTISQNSGTLSLQVDELAAGVSLLEDAEAVFVQPEFESITEDTPFDEHDCYDESVSTADLEHDDILRQYDNVDEVSRETFEE